MPRRRTISSGVVVRTLATRRSLRLIAPPPGCKSSPVIDLADKRVLVFIVAYNAEKTIASVLSRIPEELRNPNVEVLIIDDFSKDKTFHAGLAHSEQVPGLKVNELRNPENQGYGGNQKL